MAFTGKWGGPISNAGWFIGLIISLYLCFPFISRWMKERPYATIIAMVLVSLVSRYIIISYNVGDESMWRWFPLCNLIWFSFGIFIVRMGLFPRTMNKLDFIRSLLSDMSFSMFLLNFMIIDLAVENLFMYIIVLLMLSWMFMLADNRMQKMLKSIILPTLSLKNLERYARRNIYQLVAVEIVFILLIGSMVFVVKPMIEHDNGIKVKQLYQESYNDTVASYQNVVSSYGAFNGSSVGSFKIWMDEYCDRTNNMYNNLHHLKAYGDLYKPFADFYEQKNIDVNISLYYGLVNESVVKVQVYKKAYDSWYWNGTQPIGFQ